jgi:predicted DNA binding protein
MNECKPMNGTQIAKKLGITRQAVSCSIRKSMRKMYHRVLNDGIADTPFQAVVVLMGMLNVSSNSITDIKVFLKMFDKDIIDSVTKDASREYNVDN